MMTRLRHGLAWFFGDRPWLAVAALMVTLSGLMGTWYIVTNANDDRRVAAATAADLRAQIGAQQGEQACRSAVNNYNQDQINQSLVLALQSLGTLNQMVVYLSTPDNRTAIPGVIAKIGELSPRLDAAAGKPLRSTAECTR